ncbi:MAG TPA: HAMP domain-containing sensor histidine kinase [Thermomicrobiales bacterium]|jgi:signal transduction histidine kinase
MSIRARIAVFAGATVAVTLVLFGVLLHVLASYGLRNDQQHLLRDRAEQTVAALAAAPAADFAPRGNAAAVDLRAAGNTTNGSTFVEVLDANGAAIVSTGLIDGSPPTIDQTTLASATSNGHALATVRSGNPPGAVGLRVYVLPWTRPDLGRTGFVVAGQSAGEIDRQLTGLRRLLVITSLLILLGAFAAIWRVAGRALRPLGAIARTVDEIGQTRDLSRRLPPVRTGDDLDRLTVSFNAMLARLEETHTRLAASLETQQRFVADASHELRTPLTTIRSNAGFLLARPDVQPDDRTAALQDIAAESERMSRLVDHLLTLARADAGHRPPKTPLDLAPLLRDVHRQAQRLHPTRDVILVKPNPSHPVCVAGNADALTQLLWILVDNAVKHTPRGGRIELHLGRDEPAGIAGLAVRDDGTGIPEPDLPRIFDRFYQADRARTGTGAGLGLAIARWIAEDHDGRLAAANNPDRGATFSVTLPLASPPEPTPPPSSNS